MPQVCRLGDTAIGGATAISASSNVFANTLAIHRAGDSWSDGGYLVSGSSTVFINKLPCGRIGDPISKPVSLQGGAVATGSPNVFADGGSASGPTGGGPYTWNDIPGDWNSQLTPWNSI